MTYFLEPLLVLIEYVPYGDLLGYLRKSRGLNDTYFKDPDIKPRTNLTSEQLMKFAWQIADGMSYLSSRSVSQRIWVRLDMNCERLGNTMKNVIDIELLINIPGVYKISSKPCQLYQLKHLRVYWLINGLINYRGINVRVVQKMGRDGWILPWIQLDPAGTNFIDWLTISCRSFTEILQLVTCWLGKEKRVKWLTLEWPGMSNRKTFMKERQGYLS